MYFQIFPKTLMHIFKNQIKCEDFHSFWGMEFGKDVFMVAVILYVITMKNMVKAAEPMY